MQGTVAELTMTLQVIGEGLEEGSALQRLQRLARSRHGGKLAVGEMKERVPRAP